MLRLTAKMGEWIVIKHKGEMMRVRRSPGGALVFDVPDAFHVTRESAKVQQRRPGERSDHE